MVALGVTCLTMRISIEVMNMESETRNAKRFSSSAQL